MTPRHVILLTYGEPPGPAFGAQLVYSWRILLGLTRTVAPIPRPVLPLIALLRARARRALWTAERYASPLEPLTRAQADALQRVLDAGGDGAWRVHVAYEFRDPLLANVLDAIPGDEPVDVVPMYVADSSFTHGISRLTLRDRARRSGERAAPVRVVPPVEEGEFAALAAAFVARELEARNIGGPDWALVLAAHGTLLEPRAGIETGRAATECIAAGIAQRLAPRFGRVVSSWLNHKFGGRWTQPPVDEALASVAQAGLRRVVYFPYGFYADNAESELEGRIALRAGRWEDAVHLPCLNADAALVDALARCVRATGSTTDYKAIG